MYPTNILFFPAALPDHWGWHLIGGSLTLVLAVFILTQWREAAAWVIGLLVGVDLIFSGWTLLMLAVAVSYEPTKR